MGRYRKTKEEPTPQSNSLVASAVIARGSNMRNLSRTGQDDAWQHQAWEFYHTIGEYRYACDWVGAQLSKAIMYAVLNKDGKQERLNEGDAYQAISELFNDPDDRAEMLRQIGIHFTVTGECFLVAYDSILVAAKPSYAAVVACSNSFWECNLFAQCCFKFFFFFLCRHCQWQQSGENQQFLHFHSYYFVFFIVKLNE